MNNQTQILVACHKPSRVYKNDIYMPIHVGRAVSPYKKQMADYLRDDTGDNISDKNPMYCELTAQYWAWKNLHDVEYVGFCHYRRFYDCKLTQRLPKIFRNYDIVLIKESLWTTVENDLIRYVSMEDVTIFLKILKKFHPEYERITLKYLHGNILYSKNMMICRKELFDKYAEWIFPLLQKCEKYMKVSSYTRARRSLAYLGEYFMPVYMLYHHFNIYNTHVTKSPLDMPNNTLTNIKNIIKNCHHKTWRIFIKSHKTFEDYYCPAVLVGLEADNIKI